MHKTTMAATAFAALFLVQPASAADRQECESAIKQTQSDAAQNPILQDSEARMGELQTSLARAGEAGQEGDFDRCLEIVRDARGAAGLRVR